MKIFTVDLNTWKKKTEAAKRRIRVSASKHVQKRVLLVYKEALRVSPQWSGNYAYNWQIEFSHNPNPGYDRRFKADNWKTVYPPKKAGDPAAINAAYDFAKDLVEQIKWNHKVQLVNPAPVAPMIEAGTIKLRPENLIPGGKGVIAHLNMKFNYLGR